MTTIGLKGAEDSWANDEQVRPGRGGSLRRVGAILAGRVLAAKLMAARLVPALAGVLACYALFLLYDASRPAPFSPNQRVASWLTAHHLRYGLASYWEANSVTIDSGGHVRVVPVRTAGATLVITHWTSVASLYDPRLHDARFVIFKALQGMPVANRSSPGVRTATSLLPAAELPRPV